MLFSLDNSDTPKTRASPFLLGILGVWHSGQMGISALMFSRGNRIQRWRKHGNCVSSQKIAKEREYVAVMSVGLPGVCRALCKDIVGEDWRELYDPYRDMCRAVGVKKPQEGQKVKALWKMKAVVAIAGHVPRDWPRHRWRGHELAMDDLGLMEALYRVFSFSFTRFASRWSQKPIFRALEAPDDEQNDVGYGDARQGAAVPAQEDQCGCLISADVGVCNLAVFSFILEIS